MATSKLRAIDKTPRAEPRIVVKFKEHRAADAAMMAQLERSVGARFTPFAALEPELRAASQAPFDRYAIATARDRGKAEELARTLQALEEVDVAYVESGPAPPPSVNPADDPRFLPPKRDVLHHKRQGSAPLPVRLPAAHDPRPRVPHRQPADRIENSKRRWTSTKTVLC